MKKINLCHCINEAMSKEIQKKNEQKVTKGGNYFTITAYCSFNDF